VRAELRGAETWVVVEGDLDVAVLPAAESVLLEAAGADRPVVVDLRSCDFVDSSGLRVLYQAHLVARRRGGGVAIVPSMSARRAIELAGFEGELVLREAGEPPAQAV